MGIRTSLLVLLFVLPGCGYYTFSGASIPAHLATIAIPLAEDRSLSPITILDDTLTELLIERFIRQTRLTLVDEDAEPDILLTTQITRYANQPTSVTGQETAQFNRITLTVAAQYRNLVDDDALERSFSSFDDYDPLQGGLEAEEGAALNALANIADDLFTAATSNW